MKYERVFDEEKFIGFACDQGRLGWWVQVLGEDCWRGPRVGLSRDEAIAYLKEIQRERPNASAEVVTH